MKFRTYPVLVGVIGLSLLLGACAVAAQPEPTATAAKTYAPTWTPMNPPYNPALEEPTVTPTTEPTEVVAVDYCVACHTDKEQLISTAKVEEVAEKESEGVG